MSKHKCIYCGEEKDESAFNREHVLPQMMGTYEPLNYVLNDKQVCWDCNTFFSRNLETDMSCNSFEGFLRFQFLNPSLKNNTFLRGKRTTVIGNEGLLKGQNLSVVTDNTNSANIQLKIAPSIGIIKDVANKEYDRYTLNELPQATDEVLARIRLSDVGIITAALDKNKVELALKAKGYLSGNFIYCEKPLEELHENSTIDVAVRFSVDSITRRIAAKTVFNFLCYSTSKDFVLKPRFNAIRDYIRNGTWSDSFWFKNSFGFLQNTTPPNDTAHSVGYMLYEKDEHFRLCGCVTWFGKFTYVVDLGNAEVINTSVPQIVGLLDTKMVHFDNINRKIAEEVGVFIYQKQ